MPFHIMLALAWTVLTTTPAHDTLSIRVVPASLEVHGDTVRIAYRVTNTPTSTSRLFQFTVDAPAPALRVEAPPRTARWHVVTATDYGRSVANWGFLNALLGPGETSPFLAFSARGLPGIVEYWGEPWVAPDTVDVGDDAPPSNSGEPAGPGGPGNFATDSGVTVGVVPFPADRSRAALLTRLGGLLHDACARGWVDNAGVCTSLRVKIEHGDTDALLNELEAQRGKHLNALAYFLLAGNVHALPAS
jgi:hypothetical protein